MEEIIIEMLGKIFKEYREARHISLSQAAGQVCSKSMLSRFENGQNDISAQKLLHILENIHTEFDEFAQAVHDKYQNNQTKLLDQIHRLMDLNDFQPLQDFYQQKRQNYLETGSTADFLDSIIIKAHLCAVQPDCQASQEETDFLHDYLFSVPIWGRYEMTLFSHCTPLLSPALYAQYTQEMTNRPDFPKLFENNRNTFHSIFLNGFLLCIGSRAFEEAAYFESLIEAHFYQENETYLRIIYRYAKGELAFLTGDRGTGRRQMQEAIQVLRLLDCHFSADYYEASLEKIEKESL